MEFVLVFTAHSHHQLFCGTAMIRKAYRFFGLVWVSLLSGAVLAQAPHMHDQKVAIDSLLGNLLEVQAKQKVMSKQADSLARAISALKQRQASPFEARNLEAALARSQKIADSLQLVQAREQNLDRLVRQKAEVLLKNLNDEMSRLAELGKQAKKSGDTAERERVTREIKTYRQWQSFCQQILAEPPPAIIIYEVRAEPHDDDAALKRKADFLRDQADRLAREVQRLDQRLTEVREEEAVRQRVNEFASDIALLEPLNEGVRSSRSQSTSGFGPAQADNLNVNEGVARSAEVFSASSAGSAIVAFSLPAKISDLSSQDLRKWQDRLRLLLEQRQAQVDSLKRRADAFEQLGRTRSH